jgi:hypothetical protein
MSDMRPAESDETSHDNETPDWLADMPPADKDSTAVESDDEAEALPDWMSDMPPADDDSTAVESDDEAEALPDWMSDMRPAESDETPLEFETDDDDDGDIENLETPDWLQSEEVSPPDWLIESDDTETDTPEWLVDLPDETPVWLEDAPLNEEQSPEWLTIIPESDVDDTDEITETAAPLPNWMDLQATPHEDEPTEINGDAQPVWLADLRPDESPMEDDAIGSLIPTPSDRQTFVSEPTTASIGMTTLPTVIPIAASVGLLDRQGLLNAANEFYEIATQPPQPAKLPAPLTNQEKLMGNAIRAALYLFFIALIALPLLPGLQKTVGDQTVAWTEPMGALGMVLDKQRRELISEELGAIDVQPADSVALVSFDYTPATDGEMRPLAQAIISRLRGQGMRVIAVSLNPEGATLAQQTLDEVLTQRDETYGEHVINLGFVPGQINGIRALTSKPQFLITRDDFKTGVPLDQFENWQDVDDFGQVNLVVILPDDATTARWWIEQLSVANQTEQYLLAATSATVGPFMQPYADSGQLDGLISGITGAAAIEATRNNFGLARQMLDSQSIAHLIIIILIAAGTIVGWMPPLDGSDDNSDSGNDQPIKDDDDETDEDDEI